MENQNDWKVVDNNFFSSPENILHHFASDLEYWLAESDIKVRLKKYGQNKLKTEKEKSVFIIFLSQLNDWLIYVLLSAVIITLFLGRFVDAWIILWVIFINAIIWTVQEKKANHSIEALKKLSSPHAIVKRNWVIKEINANLIVPWDIIILEAGRFIPADLKLIESHNLQIDESVLTWESVPTHKNPYEEYKTKDVSIWDRKDLAYMSTLITYWRWTWIVIKTWMNTEMWKIARSIDSEKEAKTPLEIKMWDLWKKLWFASIIICVIMFIIASLQWRDLAENFLMAVSLAVASIPEWLAAIVAIVLSIWVTKMSKENAIVRKLYSVEALWSINVICSDKTWTLTYNEMTVSNYFSLSWSWEIIRKQNNKVNDDIKFLAKAMALCSDATYEDDKTTWDPTEIALLYFAKDVWLEDKETLDEKNPRVWEIPFDSDRKLMSTMHKKWSIYTIYTKWAVDNLLKISNYALINWKKVKLTQKIKDEYLENINNLSSQALRTLGLAYKESKTKVKNEEMEKDLILVWMVAMIDPPRTEVKESISEAKKAWIDIVMITWDHKNTAFAIAKKLDISNKINEVITGEEIEKLNDKALKSSIDRYKVFARVSPEHKVRIVRALQSQNKIIAMIWDWVNDAPSLSASNIWVAMWSWTDVARWAAEIILTDDNFWTIVTAINSWRNIYNNIKKSINFLLSSNLWEVIAMFISVLLGFPMILTATQLLWINLLTDSLPAIALWMEPWDSDVMKEKPRSVKQSFFTKESTKEVLFIWVLIWISTIIAFYIWYHKFDAWVDKDYITEYARTMAFLVVIAGQLSHAFSLRNNAKTIFELWFFSNIYLVWAVIVALALQIVLLFVPVLRNAFGLQLISFQDLLIVIWLWIIPFIIIELKKVVFHKKSESTM